MKDISANGFKKQLKYIQHYVARSVLRALKSFSQLTSPSNLIKVASHKDVKVVALFYR